MIGVWEVLREEEENVKGRERCFLHTKRRRAATVAELQCSRGQQYLVLGANHEALI